MCGWDSVSDRSVFGCVLVDIYLNRASTVPRKFTTGDSETAQ